MLASIRRVGLCALALGLSVVHTAGALAQEAQPTPEQVATAEELYDRGTQAYRERRFTDAARWYELADEAFPASAALVQAIRALRRAGDDRRAATVATFLVERDGPRMRRHARFVRRIEARSVTVRVECGDCRLEIDGEEVRYQTVFLSPSDPHRLIAHYDRGEVAREVTGAAGERQEVRLERPPAPTVSEPVVLIDEVSPGAGEQPDTGVDFQVIPWPVFAAVAGATLVAGGFAIAWAIQTSDAVAQLDAEDTLVAFRQARARQDELQAFTIGALVGVGLSSIIAVFTKWEDDSDDSDDQVSLDWRLGVDQGQPAFRAQVSIAWQ